mgnify:CR=1 FL=1
MRKILNMIAATLLFLITPIVFASEIPTDLRALEVSDTTIHLDWEDSNDAIGYYMYYGTQTGSWGSYEIQGVDLVDVSEFTLEWLSPTTRYYIAVTSVDEFWTESDYSDEFEYVTLAPGAESEATSFRITKVEVVDKSTLEFFFSSDLDTSVDAVMEFIVQEKISGKEVNIDISQVNEDNKQSVLVLLGEELVPALEYKVTVLDIRDSGWNTIESGIDGFISFLMPVIQDSVTPPVIPVIEDEIPVEDETPDDVPDETPPIDLNAAAENTSWEVTGGNAGVTLSQDSIDTLTSQAAENNEKLPQTGPEQWILLLFLTFLTVGWYSLAHKKYSHTSVK